MDNVRQNMATKIDAWRARGQRFLNSELYDERDFQLSLGDGYFTGRGEFTFVSAYRQDERSLAKVAYLKIDRGVIYDKLTIKKTEVDAIGRVYCYLDVAC